MARPTSFTWYLTPRMPRTMLSAATGNLLGLCGSNRRAGGLAVLLQRVDRLLVDDVDGFEEDVGGQGLAAAQPQGDEGRRNVQPSTQGMGSAADLGGFGEGLAAN